MGGFQLKDMSGAEDECVWRRPPGAVRASGDEVHVWRATLRRAPADIAALGRLLSEDERERAARFRFARDRDDFTAARGTLRLILGLYTGRPPSGLRFIYNSFGKPSLEDVAAGGVLRFNLSHAGGVALYAVASGREVGIDLELMREDLECEELAGRFFSRREVAALRALPAEERTRAFFNCWTRKEAYIKARGQGLSLPLDSFDITLSPHEPPALLATRGDAKDSSRWSLRELTIGPGYAAALAVEGSGWYLQCWSWDA